MIRSLAPCLAAAAAVVLLSLAFASIRYVGTASGDPMLTAAAGPDTWGANTYPATWIADAGSAVAAPPVTTPAIPPELVVTPAAPPPIVQPAGEPTAAGTPRLPVWPAGLFAIVTLLALALGTAGASVPWLAWLARGTAATLLGAVAACGSSALDAIAAGGSWAAIGTAAIVTALAFWRARRPPAAAAPVTLAPRLPTERGSISALLVIVVSGLVTVGAMSAWSCSSSQRAKEKAAVHVVVDCLAPALAAHAGSFVPAFETLIRTGDWTAITEAAKGLARDVAGCAIGQAVARVLEPAPAAPQGLLADPGPDPAAVRAGWDALQRQVLEGRRYAVAGMVL